MFTANSHVWVRDAEAGPPSLHTPVPVLCGMGVLPVAFSRGAAGFGSLSRWAALVLGGVESPLRGDVDSRPSASAFPSGTRDRWSLLSAWPLPPCPWEEGHASGDKQHREVGLRVCPGSGSEAGPTVGRSRTGRCFRSTSETTGKGPGVPVAMGAVREGASRRHTLRSTIRCSEHLREVTK